MSRECLITIDFKYGDKELKIVKDLLYLGIKFSRSGSFSNAKKELVNMGTKAMYELLKRGRLHNLSIQCQLELFDSMHGRANNTLYKKSFTISNSLSPYLKWMFVGNLPLKEIIMFVLSIFTLSFHLLQYSVN
jgi:hypothetical protein